jgi:hypothetical protein
VHDHGPLYERARDRLIEYLTLIYVDVRELRRRLTAVKVIDTVPAAGDLTAIAEAAGRMQKQADALSGPINESAKLGAMAAAEIEMLRRAIATLRGDLAALDPGSPPADATSANAAANLALTNLEKVRDATDELTVPYQARELLSRRRVGRAVPFAEVFHPDDPPSAERRKALLTQLEAAGSYLNNGVVDIAREILWRKSVSPVVRGLSACSAVAFAVLAALVLLVISSLPQLDGKPLGDNSQVLWAYLIVLFGAAMHLAVETLKQSQQDDSPILPMGELVDWLHLRWASIGWSFFYVIVTVVGLRLTVKPDVAKDDWDAALIYFFAGYSVDSVAGIFLQRFGTSAKAGVARVTALLTPSSP